MRNDSLLLQPIQVGNLTLKNRIMFPPLTTGYEERDGSIGQRSLAFYERLAKGGTAFVVIGDVAPVMTASPTPKLCDDRSYAIDESRRKIIWGTYPDSDAIIADATKALNNVVKNFPYDFGDYI